MIEVIDDAIAQVRGEGSQDKERVGTEEVGTREGLAADTVATFSRAKEGVLTGDSGQRVVHQEMAEDEGKGAGDNL